jgi:ketosteroid isomerase-like protein
MTTKEIAEKLVAHCRQAAWETAQRELYAPDAVSIEPYETPQFAQETRGLEAIFAKGKKFESLVETMHALTVSDPVVASSSFACTMSMDVTMKGAGRMQMTELCVYDVKDGKIVSERFHM